MQIAIVARRAIRVSNSNFSSLHFVSQHCSSSQPYSQSQSQSQSRFFRTFSPQFLISSGKGNSNDGVGFPCSKSFTSSFCSVAVAADGDTVKELHDKILESIKVKRSAPPNAWLWSTIEKCKNQDDIKLLFEALKQLRIFRLSNLRIHDNFNCNLCHEVTKACVRAGALDFGKKVLWIHNEYGLTPTTGSANQLLSHAKEQKNVKLMVDIMSHFKKNDLPVQPATADIVLSICYNTDNWELMCKYAIRFVKNGVKLRKTSFEIWLDFASRKGNLESLWKIEKLRSELYKKHTIMSGFSCCKGLLLEHKPEDAATLLQDLIQNFPDSKMQAITAELQKLVSEWPAEVIKHLNEEDQKASITSLKADIPAMIHSLSSAGIDSSVNLDSLNIA